MNAQEQFWAGEFGNQYTARNRVDWRARIPFWRHILDMTGARSVYEVGCNAGWNLSAIKRAYQDVQCYGSDVNGEALYQAERAGLTVYQEPCNPWRCELVFTAGVLIHIAPDNLRAMMQRIVEMSTHYVLAVEYSALTEESVEYRGHADRLWKRPYGVLYAQLGLTLIESAEAQGFDRCHYWLLSK